MENSKRIQRAIKQLEKIEENLEFYTNGAKGYTEDFQQLKELIEELGLDKKTDHVRFAKKLKAIWEASNNKES